MTYARGSTEYCAIRDAASDPAQQPTEVDRDEFWDMLEVLPPIYLRGVAGFLVSEPITSDERGTVYANYFEQGERYFARYHVIP